MPSFCADAQRPIDTFMTGLRPPVVDIGAPVAPRRGRIAVLVGVFALVLLATALIDRIGLESGRIVLVIVGAALLLFLLVGLVSHGRRPADHYAADRSISPRHISVATASATAGIVMLAVIGGEMPDVNGIASLILGLLVGVLAAGLLFAPGLRRAAGYTAGDFLALRFGMPAHFLAALVSFTSSSLLFIAFLKAATPLSAIVFGASEESAVFAAAALCALALLPGGSRSLAWTQAMQTLVLLAACGLAAAYLFVTVAGDDSAAAVFDLLLPAFSAGVQSVSLEAVLLPGALVAIGVASLPFLLERAATARSGGEARSGLCWAALMTVLILAAAVVLHALLQNAIGIGLIGVLAGDLLEQATFFASVPSALAGLVLAGAFAALLGFGQAALLSAASAISHDFWDETIDRKAPAGRRIIFSRLMIVLVAAAGARLAPEVVLAAPALLGWGLAIASAGFFAPLLLGIHWRRCTSFGGLFGMAAGFALAALLFVIDLRLFASLSDFTPDGEINPLAAGGLGVLASAMVAILVSFLATPKSDQARKAAARRAPVERPA